MNGPSRDNKFYLFIFVSLLLHCLLLWLLMLPSGKVAPSAPPTMIELGDLRTVEELFRPREQPVKRQSDQRRRVERERAPQGERQQVKPDAAEPRVSQPAAPQTPQEKVSPQREASRTGEGSSKFRRRSPQGDDSVRLFPAAERLAKLEEGYRRKYGPEVADSDTAFLDTDDIQFGSFLRRFENAIYGVWRYPADAARLGVEGVTAVRITFNRRGEVEKYEIMEGSGSRLLDDEVGRTLKTVGRIGGFPSGYDKDQFHLIAFFHYSIIRGSVRGTLR
jgi:protein TonB